MVSLAGFSPSSRVAHGARLRWQVSLPISCWHTVLVLLTSRPCLPAGCALLAFLGGRGRVCGNVSAVRAWSAALSALSHRPSLVLRTASSCTSRTTRTRSSRPARQRPTGAWWRGTTLCTGSLPRRPRRRASGSSASGACRQRLGAAGPSDAVLCWGTLPAPLPLLVGKLQGVPAGSSQVTSSGSALLTIRASDLGVPSVPHRPRRGAGGRGRGRSPCPHSGSRSRLPSGSPAQRQRQSLCSVVPKPGRRCGPRPSSCVGVPQREDMGGNVSAGQSCTAFARGVGAAFPGCH